MTCDSSHGLRRHMKQTRRQPEEKLTGNFMSATLRHTNKVQQVSASTESPDDVPHKYGEATHMSALCLSVCSFPT